MIYVMGQLPIKMRYQEWFTEEVIKNLWSVEKDNKVINLCAINYTSVDEFSTNILAEATLFEVNQMRALYSMSISKDDTILLLDASFPGVFGASLLKYKPCKVVAFVHGSTRNQMDLFDTSGQRIVEDEYFCLFDKLLFASSYSMLKWKFSHPNCVNLGALPIHPLLKKNAAMYKKLGKEKKLDTVCVSRIVPQKVNNEWMQEWPTGGVDQMLGFRTWKAYYSVCARYKYMLFTCQEETYGIPIREAIALGVIPICPNHCCYPEFVPASNLYDVPLLGHTKGMFDKVLQTAQVIPEPLNLQQENDFYKNLYKEITNV